MGSLLYIPLLVHLFYTISLIIKSLLFPKYYINAFIYLEAAANMITLSWNCSHNS